MNLLFHPDWYILDLLPNAIGLCRTGFRVVDPAVVSLLILATGSVMGLGCVWAGLGKLHWFWRMAAILAIASLVLLIPAYELLIWFFAQGAVTIPPLLFFRHRNAFQTSADRLAPDENAQTTRRGLQWSLRGQLLSCALLSGVVAAAVQIPSEIWTSWVPLVLVGLLFGISALVGAWAAYTKWNIWLRLAAICLVPPSAITASWLGLLRTCQQGPKSAALRRGTVWLARMALATSSLLIFVPPAAVFCLLLHRTPIPASSELPDPNGFTDLLRATKTLKKAYVDMVIAHPRKIASDNLPLETVPEEELRIMASASTEGLAIARAALNRDCEVPLDYANYDARIKLLGLGTVRYALKLERELAEREGRTADAAQSCLDTIRLGYCARGGTTTDALIGSEFQGRAIERLRDISRGLTSRQCRDLAGKIYLLERTAEPPEIFEARELAAVDHSWRWQDRVSFRFVNDNRAFRNLYRLGRALVRLQISCLALQAYHEDHGAWPESLAGLTPKYLPGVLEDPFTAQTMPYHRTSQGYRLYCALPSGPGIAPRWKGVLDFSYAAGVRGRGVRDTMKE